MVGRNSPSTSGGIFRLIIVFLGEPEIWINNLTLHNIYYTTGKSDNLLLGSNLLSHESNHFLSSSILNGLLNI